MSEMRAAMFDRYGPPEVLYAGTVPVPVVGPDRVLIRVHAVTVNGGELVLRAGQLPRWFLRGKFPRQLGLDYAGTVVEVGGSVTQYAVGDNVWGLLDSQPDENGQMLRSLAEYVAVPAAHISLAPKSLSPTEAATLPAGGLTALVALRREAGLRPGERLLVRGASGGVGSAVVQLGKLFGAHVTALAGAKNLDFVTGLGADEVYDYRTTGPEQLGRFDVVVDIVGTQMFRYRRLLGPGGRMVAVRFDTDHYVRSLAGIAASTVYGRGRIRFFRGSPDPGLLAELAQMADDGTLRPLVDEVYPFSQLADAHRRLETGGVRGKVVIGVS
jgi:NADPH:quinone reductase-like Zn-dependent oxidoreductase